MKLLAICGSLRASSSNFLLLKGLASLAPSEVSISFFDGLAQLPHFNPDLDNETPPMEVVSFRKLLAQVEGLIISSPEYAHGVPGSLKNGLDWIVSSGELVEKPVLLIHASTEGGQRVQSQLAEILKTMSAEVQLGPPLFTGKARKAFDENGRVADPEVAEGLRRALELLMETVQANPKA